MAPSRPTLTVSDLPPASFQGLVRQGAVRDYGAHDLSGYTGSTDSYLAYGFVRLVTARYRCSSETNVTMTVELCECSRTEEAYGLYSESRTGAHPPIGQESTYAPGLLSTWQGRVWLKIASEPQSDRERDRIFRLARELVRHIPAEGNRPALLNLLPPEGLVEQRAVYFHTQTTLNHLFYLGADNVLSLGNDTEAVLAEYRREDAFPYLLAVRYQSPQAAAAAAAAFAEGYALSPNAGPSGMRQFADDKASDDDAQRPAGTFVGWETVGPLLIICFEATEADQAGRLIEETRNRVAVEKKT